jgi:hypothetical protein
MSHITKIEIEIMDLGALRMACTRLDLGFHENQRTFKNYNRSAEGECDHAIGLLNNAKAYEIGVARRENAPGYELKWDSFANGYGLVDGIYDGAHCTSTNRTADGALGLLKQAYAAEAAMLAAQQQGYIATEQTLSDGSLRISISR